MGWNKHHCADHIQLKGYALELAAVGRFPVEQLEPCINNLVKVGYSHEQVRGLMQKAIELTNNGFELNLVVADLARACLPERRNA